MRYLQVFLLCALTALSACAQSRLITLSTNTLAISETALNIGQEFDVVPGKNLAISTEMTCPASTGTIIMSFSFSIDGVTYSKANQGNIGAIVITPAASGLTSYYNFIPSRSINAKKMKLYLMLNATDTPATGIVVKARWF
jgi:hypothetical protein